MSRGDVRLRSNVTRDADAWHLVPGELVERYRPGFLGTSGPRDSRQHLEKMYYVPCARCRRYISEIRVEGCNRCSEGPSASEVEAARRRRAEIERRVAALRKELQEDL